MSAINESVTHMIQSNRAKAPEESKPTDERVRKISPWRILLDRPELGSIAGTVLVFVFFGIFAGGSGMFALDGVINWAQVAGYLGIIAVGACLLMIAGEFDLSMGSMIGFAGVMVAIPPMYLGLAAVGGRPLRLRGIDGARCPQRLPRGPHEAALVHRHAGFHVHPARPDAGAFHRIRQQHDRQRHRRQVHPGPGGLRPVPGHHPALAVQRVLPA